MIRPLPAGKDAMTVQFSVPKGVRADANGVCAQLFASAIMKFGIPVALAFPNIRALENPRAIEIMDVEITKAPKQ